MIKLLKKYPIIFSIFFVLWAVFLFYSRSLFLEIPDLTTSGTSLIIQMLEFSTYRSRPLMLYMAIYFILVSFNFIYIQFILKNESNTNKYFYLGVNLFLVLISIVLSNIFALVTIFLVFLSYIIVWSSQKVYTVFIPTVISYDEGELVYTSPTFESEKVANDELTKVLNKSIYKNKLVGELVQEEDHFYFKILTTCKLQIDKKELL